MRPIRLVTFDALHTLITPRLPIHVQYSQVFEPYIGTLDPQEVKRCFKIALKQLQKEKPAYINTASGEKEGIDRWWGAVIQRTAVGAGADAQLVEKNLEYMVPALMHRFSSKEGYKFFDDAVPVLTRLHDMGIRTAMISNADSRIRSVLLSLDAPASLAPIVLSEEEGIEKPSSAFFHLALQRASQRNDSQEPSSPRSFTPEECLHVGDELESDYYGALRAGFRALLLRRSGEEYDVDNAGEDVQCIKGLEDILDHVSQ